MIRNALKHRENVHICKCVLLILCACASQNDQSQKKRRWAIHIPFEIEAKMWPKNTCIKNGQKLREYKMAKKVSVKILILEVLAIPIAILKRIGNTISPILYRRC